jgi:hypothetical protein
MAAHPYIDDEVTITGTGFNPSASSTGAKDLPGSVKL